MFFSSRSTCPKRITKGTSLDTQMVIKAAAGEHQEGRGIAEDKGLGKYNKLFSLEFSKSCWTVEANVTILSDVLLNTH